MKNKLYLIFFVVLISASSCSRKVLIQEAYYLENESQELSKDRVDIKTFFAGDDGVNITFQIDIDNRSESPVVLSERDIQLELKYKGRRRDILTPIRKADLIQNLMYEEERLESEKKADTAANIILSGVGILGGIVAGGSPAETIIYGSGSAADIVTRRNEYNTAQGSIEERIAYIEKYTLDETTIQPGSQATYDIHFDRVMANCFSELVVFYGDADHRSEYELEVQTVKVRR